MTTYFCSDPHAFHGNIMKHCRRLAFMTLADRAAYLDLEGRGGDLRTLRMSEASIDAMNRGLAANINARVGPGDTLWCLAEAALQASTGTQPTDRQVAQAWPSWWAANRDAVGADPDLLHPGTSLRRPAGG